MAEAPDGAAERRLRKLSIRQHALRANGGLCVDERNLGWVRLPTDEVLRPEYARCQPRDGPPFDAPTTQCATSRLGCSTRPALRRASWRCRPGRARGSPAPQFGPTHRKGFHDHLHLHLHDRDRHAAPVWFITGCSTGFGLELARQAIARGYRTVMTARRPALLKEHCVTDEVLLLELDVTQPDQVEAAVRAAEARFGGIDVLVNNAGMGYFAAIEEGEDAQVRKMFDVNVFGLASMTQAVLPGMRRRRRGCIVNFSSIAGLRGDPAVGYYAATKFAVEGLSEALWQEVEPLGIQVMVVEPSGFRTDWAGRSAQESAHQIDDYMATAGRVRAEIRASSGRQPGDPVRAARAVIDAVASGRPPHHLLLGNDAFDGAMAKLDSLRQDFSACEAVARGADGPPAQVDAPA